MSICSLNTNREFLNYYDDEIKSFAAHTPRGRKWYIHEWIEFIINIMVKNPDDNPAKTIAAFKNRMLPSNNEEVAQIKKINEEIENIICIPDKMLPIDDILECISMEDSCIKIMFLCIVKGSTVPLSFRLSSDTHTIDLVGYTKERVDYTTEKVVKEVKNIVASAPIPKVESSDVYEVKACVWCKALLRVKVNVGPQAKDATCPECKCVLFDITDHTKFLDYPAKIWCEDKPSEPAPQEEPINTEGVEIKLPDIPKINTKSKDYGYKTERMISAIASAHSGDNNPFSHLTNEGIKLVWLLRALYALHGKIPEVQMAKSLSWALADEFGIKISSCKIAGLLGNSDVQIQYAKKSNSAIVKLYVLNNKFWNRHPDIINWTRDNKKVGGVTNEKGSS